MTTYKEIKEDNTVKNLRIRTVLLSVEIVALALAISQPAEAAGRGDGPIIYVTSQELYFDSIVLTDLPQKGPFQLEIDWIRAFGAR